MSYILTFTGKRFYPFDPNPEDIDIVDIAHALSNVCRFTGHCHDFYSVATHSLMVSDVVSPEQALKGLLHDATEAYLADLSTPIKALLPEYKNAERLLQSAIFHRFGLRNSMPPEVKEADRRCLVTEALALMQHPDEWLPLGQPYDDRIVVSERPDIARYRFLKRFQELTQGVPA